MRITHRYRRPPAPSGSRRSASRTFADWRTEGHFLTLTVLLVLIAWGGGSSFADTLSLIYVRLAAVIALAIFLLTPAQPDWRDWRMPMILLALLAGIMVVQLVPLPPSVWTRLPGRAVYQQAVAATSMPQPWRPLSLTPDLTVNSLVSLVVPAAVLLGYVRLDTTQRSRLLPGFLILCVTSLVLGIAQLGSGTNSALYTYKRTYEGTPVGLLANRNHQAALLAAFFPALRVWTLTSTRDRRWERRRLWLALALGVVTVPVILATGSRAGIVLAMASLAITVGLFAGKRNRLGAGPLQWRTRLVGIGIPALLAIMVLVTWRFGRALSFQRLSGAVPAAALDDDLRFRFAPLVARIIHKTFPVGTGFGSFDPVFRQYEPDSALKNTVFNHAHNELLEMVMTAGAAGAALLVVFVGWWLIRAMKAARIRPQTDAVRMALLGCIVTGIMMAASLVDYPLRTPLLQAWFAIACGWMCTRSSRRDPQQDL